MDALTELLNSNPGTHTVYVRDLLPGDIIKWEGTLCEVHEAFHNGTGWVLFLSEGIGDVYTLAYKTVQKV